MLSAGSGDRRPGDPLIGRNFESNESAMHVTPTAYPSRSRDWSLLLGVLVWEVHVTFDTPIARGRAFLFPR